MSIGEKFDQNIICSEGIYHQFKFYDYRSIYPVDVLCADYSNVIPDTRGYFNLVWYEVFKVWVIIAFVPMR